MDGYRKELAKVKNELKDVGEQIQQLLEHQDQLERRKHELEALFRQNSSKSAQEDKQWDRSDFPWSKELEDKMKSVFKIQTLRPMQLQTMNVTLSNKDCMLIMPTGGGKSLCFHLPALLSKGVTLVVSPLVALMEDQIMALLKFNVAAEMLNASTNKDTIKRVQEEMVSHNAPLKLLYVTPEKLAKSKRFMAKLEKMYQLGRFSRLVIDEVHCCSQWGHDFRPDYKFLGIMKRQFPQVPILCLTATATSKVLEDVKKILNIPNCYVFKASFNRPNLYYEVREKSGVQTEAMDEIYKLIQNQFPNQSGIVYCFSKKEADDVTTELTRRGIKVGCYHADLMAVERSRVHQAWLADKIHVVVATVAFGMGIDKPDVRFVIHNSLSKSMENLYQESGRAGRDDKKSHCILFYRLQDVFKQSSMVFTEQTGLENLYGIVAYCIDANRCRRSVIASHFGEVWDKAHCNGMCDHCDPAKQKSTQNKDVTKYCQDVLTVLDHAKRLDQRLTAIKVLESWMQKGPVNMRVKGVEAPSSNILTLERILAYMLIQGYIKEDFHFTPYSTISYLVPGPKAKLLSMGLENVTMDFFSCSNQTNGASPAASSSIHLEPKVKKSLPTTSALNPLKPKLVIINNERSAFSDMKFADSTVANYNGNKDNHSLTNGEGDHSTQKGGIIISDKRTGKKLKKRKQAIVYSDESDIDDMDFGANILTTKPNRAKKALQDKSYPSNSTQDTTTNADAIFLDSDSDFG
ncbi:hypothetical protein CHS0354_011151 [Potamilus streckersoni]|uniref:ATP-dependent DNA helicase n=1 Tax=Potamilus streckersoni TaxID=2493646 RepID=A0AAE0S1B5_9BIVA|nr:hypothetical protein CHS0354_011151 [Potamilus streckersoni]